MTFVKVNIDLNKKHYYPEEFSTKKNVMAYLDDFINSNYKIAKVIYDEDEYASMWSCYTALRYAVRKYRYCSIKIVMRSKEVYLVRTDMD